VIGLTIAGRGCQLGSTQNGLQFLFFHRAGGIVTAAGLSHFSNFRKIHGIPLHFIFYSIPHFPTNGKKNPPIG
jgi:hypothetical protein